jgi:hypothetical protein
MPRKLHAKPVTPETPVLPETLPEALLQMVWRGASPPKTFGAAIIRLLWAQRWSRVAVLSVAAMSVAAYIVSGSSRLYRFAIEAISSAAAAETIGYETIYSHHGSNDPSNEGFNYLAHNAMVGPTREGWRITQHGSDIVYFVPLTPNQIEIVNTKGWRVVVRAWVEDQFFPAGGLNANLDTGKRRYDINLWRDGNDPAKTDFVRLNSGVLTPKGLVSVQTFPGTDTFRNTPQPGDSKRLTPGRHVLQLTYDATRQAATLTIDGAPLFDDYKGHTDWLTGAKFSFAASEASGVFEDVTLALPERATIPRWQRIVLVLRRIVGSIL